jgi:hypothetical protein
MTRSPQFARLCQLLKEKSRATTDFNSVALLLTQQLCEWFHCEWVTFWQVDSTGTVLNPVASWREPSLSADRLLADTKRKRLHIDKGNAGIVWRTGRAKCVDNLVLDMCLPRSLDAKAAGLQGGIWIPVRGKKDLLGVIEILGTHYWTNAAAFLNELEIGVAVGQALEAGQSP